MLTVKAALEEATHAIGRVDAQVLMAHLLGVNRAYLAAHPMRVLTESEDARIDSMVARRAIGHPVAYLLGAREFHSREFAVSPDVLIPRPETETLVEAALERLAPDGARRAASSSWVSASITSSNSPSMTRSILCRVRPMRWSVTRPCGKL